MPIRTAEAVWEGTLKDGKGRIKGESGALDAPYDWVSRFESGSTTNPEELIGSAHASCFSMFLSALLTNAETPPTTIRTTARVHIERDDRGPVIPRIELQCEGEVPGIDQATFAETAEKAKANCPVSRALAGPEITLEAKLVG
jgi:osmotically inducible protein OsmC